MSQEIAAVLRRAAELIAEPEKWCQGSFAKNGRGGSEMPDSDAAVQWCAFGALARFCHGQILDDASEVVMANISEEEGIVHWNDQPERQHAEVLAALRAAADAEERNG